MLRFTFYSLLIYLITLYENFKRPVYLKNVPVKRWKRVEQGTDKERFAAYLEARFQRDNNNLNEPLKS